MTISEKSLRFVVDKWLAPVPAMRIRVVQFGRMGHDKRPYVHVEACAPTGPHAIFFFRHDDGCWCVFPPTRTQPAINGYRLAA